MFKKFRTALPRAAKPASSPEPRPKFNYDLAYQSRLIRVLYQEQSFTCNTGVFLSHEHFEKRTHRWIARNIIDYAKKYGHGISRDALKHQLERDLRSGRIQKKDSPALSILIKKLRRPVKDKSYIKDDLFLFIKHQSVRETILSSVEHLKNGEYAEIDKLFQQTAQVQAASNGVSAGKFYVRDLERRMKRRRDYVRNGVPTGTAIDDHLKPGGLPPKQLGCFLAPPGGGKSSALVHMGKSAILESERRERVLHVTLELADEVIEDKYDAAFSGVPISALEDELEDVENAAKRMGKKYGDFLVVKEWAPKTISVANIHNYVRQLERFAFYPTMIIVDYADLLQPMQMNVKNRTDQDVGNVYTELRALSWALEIPIWTASQANRAAVEKPVITIADIAESFQKVMIADVVVTLCQTAEEKTSRRGRLFIAKNRNGADGMQLKVKLDWARSSIKSI